MHRDEVDLQDWIGGEQGVPDVGLASVFRPAEYANVNTMSIVRQLSVPFDARVCAEHSIGLIILTEFFQQTVRRGAFPQKLIDLTWRAVTHVEAVPAQLHPQCIGQGSEPALVDV